MNDIYTFLADLCVHNNREWFDTNRDKYKNAKDKFENIIEYLISEVATFDSSVSGLNHKDCIFRIFRDTRFSNDKTPYKTNFGGFIVPGGKKCAQAGYYIHIEPDNSFVAGGIYMPPAPQLLAIRQAIFTNIDEFRNIIEEPIFHKNFGGLQGESLKSIPRGFAKDFPYADLLKFKSYNVWIKKEDEDILNPNFLTNVVELFKQMKEFNDFLNKAINVSY